MKEILHKLAALGSEVAEEEWVVALLTSFLQGDTTLVTALEEKGNNLSLPFLQQALINEEQKRDVNRACRTPMISRDAALQDERETKTPLKDETLHVDCPK